jgi:hypothetical protein
MTKKKAKANPKRRKAAGEPGIRSKKRKKTQPSPPPSPPPAPSDTETDPDATNKMDDDHATPDVYDTLLAWAETQGIELHGVLPRRIPGRGIGIVATEALEVRHYSIFTVLQ